MKKQLEKLHSGNNAIFHVNRIINTSPAIIGDGIITESDRVQPAVAGQKSKPSNIFQNPIKLHSLKCYLRKSLVLTADRRIYL